MTVGSEHVVCRVSELPPGERRILHINNISIGVFNVRGRFYALHNRCPHKGAPLCLGTITDAIDASTRGEFHVVREDAILRCPWHGWEFDIATGRSWFDPRGVRVRDYALTVENRAAEDSVTAFDVTVEEDVIVLHLDRRRSS